MFMKNKFISDVCYDKGHVRSMLYKLAAITSLSLFLFATKGIDAYASTKADVNTVYPTGDLQEVQLPETVEITEEKGTLTPRVRNSAASTANVKVGRHYAYLDDTERKIYKALIAVGEKVQPYGTAAKAVSISDSVLLEAEGNDCFSYTKQQYTNAFYAAEFDYPELVHLGLCSTYITYAYAYDKYTNQYKYNSYLVCISESAEYDQNTFDRMESELLAKRAEILADPSIANANGVLEKELAIHDKLLEINTYDYVYYNNDELRGNRHVAHTAYGALVLGTSVCDGYTKAFTFLLNGAGIDSLAIAGRTNNAGHAWNIVKLSDGWYEVDTTWDDSEPTVNNEDLVKALTHRFFNLTTQEINDYSKVIMKAGYISSANSKRKRKDFFVNFPIATSTKYSYENVVAAISENQDYNDVDVTDISLDKNSISANKGETGALTLSVFPENATRKAFVWESSDTKVVTVDNDGNLSFVGGGEAIVTVKEINSEKTVSCSIDVNSPLESISFSENTLSGEKGEVGKIKLVLSPLDASNKDFVFESSNDNIITVNNDGKYKLVGTGKAVVTVTERTTNISAKLDVDVTAGVKGISFGTENIIGNVGDTGTLDVIFDPVDATEYDLKYTSYNESVVAVDQNGNYELKGSGVATIMVTDMKTFTSANCYVESHVPFTSITFSEKKIKRSKGTDYLTYTCVPQSASGKMVWESSDESVVTVDDYGYCQFNEVGKATITVTDQLTGVSGKCEVEVYIPLNSISLEKDSITGKVGDKGKIDVKLNPSDATDVELEWKSENPLVATVDQEGNYELIAEGSTLILAYVSGTYMNVGCDVKVEGSGDANAESTSENNNENNNDSLSNNDNTDSTPQGDDNTSSMSQESNDNINNTPQENNDNTNSTFQENNDNTNSTPQENNDNINNTSQENIDNTNNTPRENDDTNSASNNTGNLGETSPEENVPETTDESISNKDNTSDIIIGNAVYDISNNEAVVSDATNKDVKKVVINNTVSYNGSSYVVTEIASNAYLNCTKLSAVTIGSNVRKIGSGAFKGCKNLKRITIKANSLKTIGSGSFKGIKKNAKITIVCKDKKQYKSIVKKLKKAGAKKATFKFKNSK